MDMSMGGMDMSSSSGPFRPTNQRIAHAYWYVIASVVALLTLVRIVKALNNPSKRHTAQDAYPRPMGRSRQALATITAMLRELSYPQPIYFTGRLSKYFTPLPLGRWLLLAVYWAMLLSFLWTNTILQPNDPMYAYKWEIVGFRAAWVSVTQIPFIYLLSCKFNPISLLTGISHERFNWLHRWAARTVFLTVIVHWSFFFTEWSLAGFVKLQLEMMPMVKYGFGAWSVIGWMVLSGFGCFRALNYEVFVAQHICAAATLLWLLYMHVPAYARYNVYMAMGFVAFDWTSRLVWALLRNTHIFDKVRGGAPGYSAHLEALPGDMVRIVIQDAAFSWKAGQHVHISIPRLGPLEMHPFTIANACELDLEKRTGPIMMLIKAHSGFSRRLYRAASQGGPRGRTYRTFISGPWGSPPDIRKYESVVLVACASGASFTVPLLQSLLREPKRNRRIVYHWMVRSDDHISWYKHDLDAMLEAAQHGSIQLEIRVHVTRSVTEVVSTRPLTGEEMLGKAPVSNPDSRSDLASSSVIGESPVDEKTPLSSTGWNDCSMARFSIRRDGRPSMDALIRPTVEAAQGETAVVVCGGNELTAQARTFVAAISDERAVHKGTGAQGIFLFTETFGW